MANKYTQKTQEALQQAQMRASAVGNPEMRPAHVLEALLKQQDGIAAPVLKATGVDPETVAREAGELISTYPSAQGQNMAKWHSSSGSSAACCLSSPGVRTTWTDLPSTPSPARRRTT